MMGFLRPAEAWPRVLLAISLLMGMLWAVSGCDDGVVDPEPPAAVSITESMIDTINTPQFWVLGSEEFRKITLDLNVSEEIREAVSNGELTEVVASFTIMPSEIPIILRDDGGTKLPAFEPEDFVHEYSGDLVPGDFRFAAQINSGFAPEAGNYKFRFTVYGLRNPDMTPQSESAVLTIDKDIVVSANEGPEFGEISIADSLHAGFDADMWTIEVSDPNEPSGDEVTELRVSLIANDVTWREILFAPLSPPTWTFAVDSTFSAGLPTNEYQMQIVAIDRFDYPSDMVIRTIWIENLAPELTDLTAPDTVYQPGPDDPPNVYAFTVHVEDSQGQGDIERVFYSVIDPTGQQADSPDFVFRDDGDGGDEVAGDRTWTHLFQVANTVSNFGTYTFKFYGEDRAGNFSLEHIQEIELVAYSEPQP